MTNRSSFKSLTLPVLASAALCAAVLAPASQAQLPVCAPGTTNTQYCQIGPPVIVAPASGAACRSAGSLFRVPKTAISSVAGLVKIVVRLDGRVIKTVHKSSVKSYTLSGVTIPTRGLKAGLHTVTITATDSGGRTSRRTLHFSICHPKPKFTG